MKYVLSVFLMLAQYAMAESYVVQPSSGMKIQSDLLVGARKMNHFDAYVADLKAEDVKHLQSIGYKVEKTHQMKIMGFKSKGGTPIILSAGQEVPWGVSAVEALAAQKLAGGNGEGITVCVVDTGVAYDHPDLAGTVVGGVGIVKSTTAGKPEYYDDMGHGTHVSGTIAAHGSIIGVAPGVKIYAIKVLDAQGSGTDADVADGIKACIGHGQVINMSLGGADASELLKKAMEDVKAAGILSACAAGNDGGPVGYPAKLPGCVAVSAVDVHHAIASFSSRGKEIQWAGPGVDVKSTLPGGGYDTWSGTSMATPHVAGVMAVRLSAKKKYLRGIDIKLPAEQQGKGLINSLKTASAAK